MILGGQRLHFKVVILGAPSVGKTSLAHSIAESSSKKRLHETVGVDFFTAHVQLTSDIQVTLQIWDVSGQVVEKSMVRNYIYGSQAALLVYDITNSESFAKVSDWLSAVVNVCGHDATPYLALVANKVDLEHERAVKRHKHEMLASSNNMYSYAVSSLTAAGVADAVLQIASDLAGVPVDNSARAHTPPAVPLPPGSASSSGATHSGSPLLDGLKRPAADARFRGGKEQHIPGRGRGGAQYLEQAGEELGAGQEAAEARSAKACCCIS